MDRTALVTGASSGIGKATALALAARGYRVIGATRHPCRLAQQRAQVPSRCHRRNSASTADQDP